MASTIRYIPPRQKRKQNNFKFAMGMGTNWADLDRGLMYMIQEYKEAQDDPMIPKNQKPAKIRVCRISDGSLVEMVAPEIVEERMKDPEPDPKYAPETDEEIRRNLRNDHV